MNRKNKSKKEKIPFEDDGRTIVPMNVDGMPWYSPTKDRVKNKDGEENGDDFDFNKLPPEEKKAYRKETWRIIFGVLGRFLPFLLIFIAAFTAVILLLYFVWVK